MANRLVARLSGVPLHDFGCTMKAYRRKVLEGVRLYGEMHRFIPIFATWQGARVAELEVHHRPRTAGRTKYGLGRTFNVVLDLILIRFYQRYAQRPMHLFGRVGLASILLSFLMFGLMLYFKYLHHPLTGYHLQDVHRDPPAPADRGALPHGGAEHPDGRPGRDGDADLLRVAVEDHLPARRGPPGPGRHRRGWGGRLRRNDSD